MQACVGPFLDQDGAEYARRFKEKYGITIDPDEAKVIAALAISENKSAHQKKVAADKVLNIQRTTNNCIECFKYNGM